MNTPIASHDLACNAMVSSSYGHVAGVARVHSHAELEFVQEFASKHVEGSAPAVFTSATSNLYGISQIRRVCGMCNQLKLAKEGDPADYGSVLQSAIQRNVVVDLPLICNACRGGAVWTPSATGDTGGQFGAELSIGDNDCWVVHTAGNRSLQFVPGCQESSTVVVPVCEVEARLPFIDAVAFNRTGYHNFSYHSTDLIWTLTGSQAPGTSLVAHRQFVPTVEPNNDFGAHIESILSLRALIRFPPSMGGGIESAEMGRADAQLLHSVAGIPWTQHNHSNKLQSRLGHSTSMVRLLAPAHNSADSFQMAIPETVAVAVGSSRLDRAARGAVWIVLIPSAVNQRRMRQSSVITHSINRGAEAPMALVSSRDHTRQMFLPVGTAATLIRPGDRGAPALAAAEGGASWGEAVMWFLCRAASNRVYSEVNVHGSMLPPDGCHLATGAPDADGGRGAIFVMELDASDLSSPSEIRVRAWQKLEVRLPPSPVSCNVHAGQWLAPGKRIDLTEGDSGNYRISDFLFRSGARPMVSNHSDVMLRPATNRSRECSRYSSMETWRASL